MKYKVLNCDLKDIQNIMLEMMADIDRVCQNHNIRYILDGGSMLGAVRHKGFIPWDDDLDIAMLRDDYIRFIEIANEELNEKYCFQCVENKKEYPYNFGKVFFKHSLFLEHFTEKLDICHGIYIDIFPMDYVDVSSPKRLSLAQKLVSKYTQVRYIKLNMVKAPAIKTLFARIMTMNFVNSRCKKNMMYFYKKGEFVQKLCHYGEHKPPVSITLFTNTQRVPFENYEFNIPYEYDSFLRGRYGDYMILPPEKDQRPMHHIIRVEI